VTSSLGKGEAKTISNRYVCISHKIWPVFSSYYRFCSEIERPHVLNTLHVYVTLACSQCLCNSILLAFIRPGIKARCRNRSTCIRLKGDQLCASNVVVYTVYSACILNKKERKASSGIRDSRLKKQDNFTILLALLIIKSR
jgi:hypothetical protein